MFEYVCGDSGACAMSLMGAIGLAIVGGGLGILGARGWLKAKKDGSGSKKPLLFLAGAVVCFLAAGALQHASTAVFGPDLAADLPAGNDPLGGDDDLSFDDE